MLITPAAAIPRRFTDVPAGASWPAALAQGA